MHKNPWKLAERDAFLQRLRDQRCTRLLELGAGTGQDSLYFQNQGLKVLATDLSPTMVAYCRDKGIDARVMDFLHLDFPPASFDAVYALNCLLHVPNPDLPAVLRAIREVLRPGGLFFLGVYGGQAKEGIAKGHAQNTSTAVENVTAWRTPVTPDRGPTRSRRAYRRDRRTPASCPPRRADG